MHFQIETVAFIWSARPERGHVTHSRGGAETTHEEDAHGGVMANEEEERVVSEKQRRNH